MFGLFVSHGVHKLLETDSGTVQGNVMTFCSKRERTSHSS